MIKYLGSKRLLLGAIDAAVGSFGESLRVLDLFSGTSRVGHALKRSGHFVVANDHLAFGRGIHRCVGAGLAQQELRSVLDAFADRVEEF